MTQLTCRVCGKPRPYLPTYGLELCWPCYLAHAEKRDRADEAALSEAIRLATQSPYEAGYRDGYAHGRLLTDHGGAVDCLLAALKEIADICQGPAATLGELRHAVEASARAAIEKMERKEA